MIDGIQNIYNRINEIKKGANNLQNTLKPEAVKEFEEKFKEMKNNLNKTEKKESYHPFVSKKEKEMDLIVEEDNKDIIQSKIDSAIKKASKKYNVSEDLIRAVISIESGYDVYSVSRTGAMGLMQLMPKTALELGVEKPFDIEENILGGTKYLKMMLDKYNNDLDKALAAYNAGPHNVDAANGIPDIEETKKYVKLVKKQLLK
ncbi:MAG TPA: lytic transglycosylase domain-containing protein [Spirochaetota bacterium]|nr:lytic transglycosylase domain-containing protein [Spirochaetota bacterium]HOL56315.1 lytic transglycosylase domain-containing protein [Spirochaetota bacterium]HPP03340.1 lytic transglycosylase domain-containing protein [Spirochaetota bacterium]